MSAIPITTEKNLVRREEFGAAQLQNSAETAIAGVTAREQARVNAMFIMAERHPRSWDTVRVRLLGHCDRPGFAEIARYKKPAGRKQVNGQWVDSFAEGLSARFAEIARQEMGNTSTETSVVYEDDLIRIVRASVMDLERNNFDSREITIAKVVERKGKKQKDGTWTAPEGRDVIGQRINSYGDPVYLVKATDDEIRNKQNSEISKAQRDESLRLIPKDIRDDCESRVVQVMNDPKKIDPTAARKRIIDSFAKIGVLPDDLIQYIGCALDKISPAQLDELRGLYTAINDGDTTFNEALQLKYDQKAASQEERDAIIDQKLTTAQADKQQQRGSEPASREAHNLESRGATPGPAPTPPTAPESHEPKQDAIISYEGDWPENPQGDVIRWNGVLYRFNEGSGNYQKAEEDATPAPPPAAAPPKAPRQRPVFGKKDGAQ